MPPSKRPAPSTLNPPRVKVRGRPAKNDVQGTATSREAAERLSENTRPYRHDSVDHVVGRLTQAPGQGWSQAHEDAMDRMWQESEHSQAVVNMIEGARKNKGITTHGHLLKLCKVCLRVFQMSPIRFLSFSHGLEYQGDRGSSATFSKAFSNELDGLIIHPAFDGKKETLAIVIQYAVICRINNRRPWPNTASTPNCPALAKMAEVLKTSESGEFEDSVHRTHTDARRECGKGGKKPSKLSDLMHAVGETVKESSFNGIADPDEKLEYRGEVVWPASLYDLKNITKTLDETIWDDDSWNCTVEDALHSYRVVFHQQEAPTGEQLPEYYERSHKQKLRDWMVKSGLDPHQQVSDEPGEGLELAAMDGDEAQDQAQPCDVPRGDGTTSLAPEVRPLSQATSNPYASLESQETSPPEGASLQRIRDLEKEVADKEREIANLKSEVASLKAANPQNGTTPALSQIFSHRRIGLDPESYLDWDDITGT
ncbi:hypothetical protein FMUND_7627 [Fusarium mundagurra]|uniref:Uncharacterized protein n=1 Tax=Fusarium mundagurra TaxID=1567541 RepID=A0A8H6DEX8_9HYPO|nr:hypothetical protein FMUND_7627 [Fusarium mundagurra]